MDRVSSTTVGNRALEAGDVDGPALDAVARCLADSIGASRVMLVGRSERRSVPHLLGAWDSAQAGIAPPWTRGSLVGQAFDSAEPIVDRRRVDEAGAARISQIAVGVRVFGRPLAALYAGFHPPSELDEHELGWRLQAYARLAALCLAGDPALAGRLSASGVDALTGCLTYGGLVEALEAEAKRSQRHGHSLACCFIDIDNDEHGHLEGNRVLAAVAAGLRGTLRAYDSIGRFGGDEFVVILPETDDGALGRVSDRLASAAREAIADATSTAIGVSIGIAEWDRVATPLELIDQADAAVRDAKARGEALGVWHSPGGREGLLARTREMMRGRGSSRREPR